MSDKTTDLQKQIVRLKKQNAQIIKKYNRLVKTYSASKRGFKRLFKKYLIIKRNAAIMRRYANKKILSIFEKYKGDTYEIVFDRKRNLVKISADFLKEIEMEQLEFAQSFYIDVLFNNFLPALDTTKAVVTVEGFQFPILIKQNTFDDIDIHPYVHFKFSGKIKYLPRKKDFFYFLHAENITSDVELQYFQKTDHLIKSLSISNFNLMKAKKTIEVQRIMVMSLTTSLIEEYNQETSEHINKIKEITEMLTIQLEKDGLLKVDVEGYDSHDYISDIVYTSVLHDIGKMGIPNNILGKSSNLTEQEREIIKQHSVIGASYIHRIIEYFKNHEHYSTYINFLTIPYNICLYHHERWDGKGYPEKLKGEEIPFPARIIALSDTYDAIRANRSYDRPRTHETAVFEIKKGKGTQFDPEIVESFLKIEKEIKKIPY